MTHELIRPIPVILFFSDALALHSLGFSITLILPSAFTSLSPSLSLLSPPARLRITAAGAWHNLLFWTALYLAGSAGFGSLWNVLGWRDVSREGLVVLQVEAVRFQSSFLVFLETLS